MVICYDSLFFKIINSVRSACVQEIIMMIIIIVIIIIINNSLKT